MKLATYNANDADWVGAVRGEHIYNLAACLQDSGQGDPEIAETMLTLLAGGPAALDAAQAAVAWAEEQGGLGTPLAEIKLRPPLPCPGKLFCLAGNYADHILEGGGDFPGKEKMIPRFFIKPCTVVIGPGDTIRIPPSAPSPIGRWSSRW